MLSAVGLRQPEKDDDGEEEDDRPPGEKAGHGCKCCVVTTGAGAALSTHSIYHSGGSVSRGGMV